MPFKKQKRFSILKTKVDAIPFLILGDRCFLFFLNTYFHADDFLQQKINFMDYSLVAVNRND